jgi:hypothetical protein
MPAITTTITTTIPITGHCRCSRRLTLAALTAPRSESYGPIEKLDVPGVQGAFVLSNVLAVDECEQILRLSEAMGYTEDAPVSLGRNVRPPAPRLRRACARLHASPTLTAVRGSRCTPFIRAATSRCSTARR